MDAEIGQNNPEAAGRTAHPGLVIGKGVHEGPENIATASEEYHVKPLHAVEVGALRALCGEEVVPVPPAPHTSAAWPPALGHACDRCLAAVAARSGGDPGPSEADVVNGRRPNP
ncbi:hypothetical protein SAMN05216199_0062 [Pedococcus cremeus]|uniref:Uncharacterized protein n=1 Tax=Pedococcus cremeus TaxID=587636 RepID=A0A1H9XPU8_9MICO|nr:hypothetical protein [Pedococcus cremeus]SES48185.1 hypothetical protein SAMN05216199_0062 [Pedococcus cremeus]